MSVCLSVYMSFCLYVFLSICLYVFLSICHVTFSKPLIGQKRECYIVEEVIEVDELEEGNTSAESGKQDK